MHKKAARYGRKKIYRYDVKCGGAVTMEVITLPFSSLRFSRFSIYAERERKRLELVRKIMAAYACGDFKGFSEGLKVSKENFVGIQRKSLRYISWKNSSGLEIFLKQNYSNRKASSFIS